MLAVPAWRISMARVLIIGASKGIGFETTLQALEAGHQVRAPARSAAGIGLSDPKLEKVRGDALISKDIEAALNGIEVVIQTLSLFNTGRSNIPSILMSLVASPSASIPDGAVAHRKTCPGSRGRFNSGNGRGPICNSCRDR